MQQQMFILHASGIIERTFVMAAAGLAVEHSVARHISVMCLSLLFLWHCSSFQCGIAAHSTRVPCCYCLRCLPLHVSLHLMCKLHLEAVASIHAVNYE